MLQVILLCAVSQTQRQPADHQIGCPLQCHIWIRPKGIQHGSIATYNLHWFRFMNIHDTSTFGQGIMQEEAWCNSFSLTVLRCSVAGGHSAAFLFAVAALPKPWTKCDNKTLEETLFMLMHLGLSSSEFHTCYLQILQRCFFFPKDWHLRPTSAILSETHHY